MTFQQPSVWFLLLLLVLPILWVRQGRARERNTVWFSSISPLERAGRTWAVRVRWIVPALRALALILLIVCIARPRKANEHTRVFTEGIAIQLLVDRSGSMAALDFEIDGKEASRLEAVKRVVEEFITGGDALPGRRDDLIGLISFGTFADSNCPLTLDHDHLVDVVRQVETPAIEAERGTAIGDAIALGVERIHSLKQRTDVNADDSIKSKVMVLLTDGESTAGTFDPFTAAEMAAAFGIKIYTIGAGSDRGFAPIRAMNQRGRVRVSIDEETLREIAALTGGQYFRATDSDSLREIYAQIDALERTEIEQRRYTEYKDMSLESITLGPIAVPPLLAVVLVLLCAEIFLSNTRFRSLP